MPRLKEVLAFVNNKGGVGKTTTVFCVAGGILRKEKDAKILVIDLDPQCNLSDCMGWDKESQKYADGGRTVFDAFSDGDKGCLPVYKRSDRFYYVPSSQSMEKISLVLQQETDPNMVLYDIFGNDLVYYADGSVADGQEENITTILESFDYVLIDCVSTLESSTTNALAVADSLVVPVQIDLFAMVGVGKIIEKVKKMRKRINTDLELRGLLLTMDGGNSNLTKEIKAYMRETYGDIVFKSVIRKCVKAREMISDKKHIFEYAPDCTTGIDYDMFVTELLSRYK